jgi:hypothetical protein
MFEGVRMLALRAPAGFRCAHPGFTDLLAYHDAELRSAQGALVARHLRVCPSCSLAVLAIEQSLLQGKALFELSDAAPPVKESRERILELVGNQERLASERERLRRERNSRIVSELSTYFGSYPARLSQKSPEADAVFDAQISRLAQLFLGRDTASALLQPGCLDEVVA